MMVELIEDKRGISGSVSICLWAAERYMFCMLKIVLLFGRVSIEKKIIRSWTHPVFNFFRKVFDMLLVFYNINHTTMDVVW